MSRELLCRLPVSWPPGCDRRALIDAKLGDHLALWSERLARFLVPGRPEATWRSDRVLEVRAAAVTLWAVLTETEVTVFWEAPAAIRLLIGQSRRKAMIECLVQDLNGLSTGRPAPAGAVSTDARTGSAPTTRRPAGP